MDDMTKRFEISQEETAFAMKIMLPASININVELRKRSIKVNIGSYFNTVQKLGS